MPNIIAKYYTDEIIEWNKSIEFHVSELFDIETKLDELTKRNGNIDVAGRIEAMQKLIDRSTDCFINMQHEFQLQEELKKDNIYTKNSMVTAEMINTQHEIRMKMREAEMDYIDLKFDCYQFLSDMLQKYQY